MFQTRHALGFSTMGKVTTREMANEVMPRYISKLSKCRKRIEAVKKRLASREPMSPSTNERDESGLNIARLIQSRAMAREKFKT